MPQANQPPTKANPPDNASNPDEGANEAPAPEPVKFPWGIFWLAVVVDFTINWIPFLNFFTDPVAGFILGFWQKKYSPKTDPVLTFIVSRIIKFAGLGILPDNVGVVVYAYIKKKVAAKLQTPLGQKLAGQIAK